MKDLQPHTKKIILLSSGVAFVVIIIILALVNIFSNNKQEDIIDIANFKDHVTNLPSTERDNIEQALYDVVKLNNGGINEASINDATIREGSYEQSFDNDIYSTVFIIDLPTLRQSYQITNFYSSSVQLTSYTMLATCLDENQLIYGDFECVDKILLEQGGKGGGLMRFLPFIVPHYTVEMGYYEKGRLTPLDIEIRIWKVEIEESDKEADVLVDYYKQEINDWIVDSGFDVANYKFNYTLKVVE